MQQITVSMLLRYLKNRLDSDDNLQKINVSGEVSNFHRHFSGHLYFTLKDERAAINCVMFKSAASTLKFNPVNGDKVIVCANTSIYESSGQLQLYVLKIEREGLGDLYARYEALKEKLNKEGKFSDQHKIKIDTEYPQRIAVLCGDHSAAWSDIQRTFHRRWPLCLIDFYPVLVQGNDAPEDIIKNLKEADTKGYDAILLARGGGSFEDLFCFNDENLVNTIYELKTFIITGIGHEQDFTLADFVADLRASTPTAAVELLTPDIEDVIRSIETLEEDLYVSMISIMENTKMNYDLSVERLLHFQDKLNLIGMKLDQYSKQFADRMLHRFAQLKDKLDHMSDQMAFRLDFKLNEKTLNFHRLETLLEAYSAQNVLNRGYTIVFQDSKVIKKKDNLEDKPFAIRFSDGMIEAIERK